MSALRYALYTITLISAYTGGQFLARGDPGAAAEVAAGRTRPRLPLATLALLALVGLPSLLQFPFPHLLTALQRDADRILHHGEWWRLATSLVVQDGGAAGTIFNLTWLVLIGIVAERLWGRRIAILFLGTGILSQLVGLAWQPIGGGNSVANFGMAAGVLLLCALRGQAPQVRLLGIVGIVGGLALLPLRDIHGGAVAIGLVLAAALLAPAGR